MADSNQQTDPAAAEGATGVQGGYGSDTGFASDQAQEQSGQAADGDQSRGAMGEPRSFGDDSAISASDTQAGTDEGGSRSGNEPRSNPDDALRTERHQSVPNGGTASQVAADVTEDIGGVVGDGGQSGSVGSQPGTSAKRMATNEPEDDGHLNRRDPQSNTGHPNAQHKGSAF